MILGTKLLPCSRKKFKRATIESWASLCNSAKAISSNSLLTSCIPIRSAKGAYISKVSLAMRIRFSGFFKKWRVLMLCRRSASLIKRTLMSSDMASKSLRKFSACFLSADFCSIMANLVKPSTNWATCSPNRFLISSTVVSVSSTVSCKRPAIMEAESSLNLVKIPATSTGCE